MDVSSTLMGDRATAFVSCNLVASNYGRFLTED
jgi:hypothetical protein